MITETKLDEVFVENYQLLFRAAKAILRRVADASDVVQELYLRCAQRELSTFYGDWKDYLGTRR